MAGFCKYCGGEVSWRDNRGWYRSFCQPCARRIADGENLTKQYDTDTGEKR